MSTRRLESLMSSLIDAQIGFLSTKILAKLFLSECDSHKKGPCVGP